MRPGAIVLAIVFIGTLFAGCMGGGSKTSGPSGSLRAQFDYSPEVPVAGEPVGFHDRTNATVVAWSWDFGDGGFSDESNPNHTFAAAGNFTVVLLVTDDEGRSDEAVQALTVGRLDGPEGNEKFRIDFTFQISGRSVEFEPIVFPRDAVVDAYHWDFGDMATSRDSAPAHAYAADGLYEVTLRGSSKAVISQAKHTIGVGLIVKEPSELDARGFVVIAVVDSGVNPYHEEFRDPAFQVHPSQYISNYPADALALSLSLDYHTYNTALKADEQVWDDVKGSKLYWIPGTRIVGAISMVQDGANKILDDDGHGTATASDAVGSTIGTCPKCLVVVVEGLGDASLNWALRQPWIDVVSNSWVGCLVTSDVCTGVVPPGLFSAAATREAVEAGREVLFAAGNGMLNRFDAPTVTYWNVYSGPDWILTVGAADARSGATIVGTGRPFDITSYGYEWKGASHQSTSSISEFSGTSAATPVAAGAYAYAVRELREAMGDTQEGPRKGAIVAQGTSLDGSARDGKVTRAEAERALLATAKRGGGQGPVSPASLPDTAASFLYAGYGLVNAATAREAVKVLLGDAAMPSRSTEDQWAAVDSRIRQAIWGGWNPGGDQASLDPSQVDPWVGPFLQELGLDPSLVGLDD